MELVNQETFNELWQQIPHSDLIDLILVLKSSRPACLIMDPDKNLRKLLKKLCDENNLYFRVEEDQKDSGLADKGFFISRDEKRFEILKSSEGRFYSLSDQDVGRFLGYPEDDVNYFAERVVESPVEHDTRRKMREMVSNGKLKQSELKFVELAGYVPRPEEENIQRALERGKNYYRSILEFDAENGFNIGKMVLEQFLDFESD